MDKVDEYIIAHRGESFDAPENTLAAINLAWARNIQSVEIDIRLTKDTEIVVIHDDDTFRISGEKNIISKSDLKELKLLDAGLHKGIKWKGEHIPTLKEVINTVPVNCRLIIEIKSDEKILEKLKSELAQSRLANFQIEIISFNGEVIAKAKQMMPQYKMLWLMDLDYYRPWWLCRINKKDIIRKVKNIQIDGVDVWSGKILTEEFISVLKEAGLRVYTWTVNDPVRARQLINSGIDGVTTDRAGWISDQLRYTNSI